VEERLAADGADLARAEEAGQGVSAERLSDGTGVVVGIGEEARPAPVAGEEQGARGVVRSSSAAAASRTWKRSVCPTRTASAIASAPVSSSTPISPRIR
jgi:hypothetical protein